MKAIKRCLIDFRRILTRRQIRRPYNFPTQISGLGALNFCSFSFLVHINYLIVLPIFIIFLLLFLIHFLIHFLETIFLDNLHKNKIITRNKNLPFCAENSSVLKGLIRIRKVSPDMKAMEKIFSMLAPGGHGEPRNCRARHRIAIIVPYRSISNFLEQVKVGSKFSFQFSFFLLSFNKEITHSRKVVFKKHFSELQES